MIVSFKILHIFLLIIDLLVVVDTASTTVCCSSAFLGGLPLSFGASLTNFIKSLSGSGYDKIG